MGMHKPNQEYYYYRSLRGQVIVFMSLFYGMKVVDIAEDSEETLSESRETKIDITYAPKERKLIEQLYEHTDPDSFHDQKVPKFSVSITSINYDNTRALNFFRTRRIKQNSKQFNDRMPQPYDIGMNLSILAKYESHLHQIIENIVPFFSPYIIVKIKENKDILDAVPRELRIDYDGAVGRDVPVQYIDTERRYVRGDLNFLIKGWVYRPISESPGPIQRIPIRFFNSLDFAIPENLLDSTEVVGPNWNG
jgi:hypothetical protein